MSTKDDLPELIFQLYISGNDVEDLLKDIISSYVNIVETEKNDKSNLDLRDKATDLIYTAIDLIN